VPLNDDAIAVLREEKGKHPERVFTYKGKTPRSGEHEIVAQCLEARLHRELSLPRRAARLGDMARDGGYDAVGAAGARRMEVRADGKALCALRTGATAHGGGPTCYVFATVAKATPQEVTQRND